MSNLSAVQKALRRPARDIAICSVATNILLLAPSLHMMQVYDRVLSSRSGETLIYITLIAVVALAAYGIAEMIRGRLAQRMSATFVTYVAEDVFRGIVRKRKQAIDEAKILRDLQTVRSFLAGRQAIGLFDLPFFPLYLLLLFALHVTLGLVAVVGIAALIGITILNNRLTEETNKQSGNANTEASGFSSAVLRRVEDIRAMGLLPSIMVRWGLKTAVSLNRADESSTYASLFYGLGRFVRQSLQVLAMAWGAYLVLNGDMSGGMIFAASMILGKTLQPIEQLIGAWQALKQVKTAWEALDEVMECLQDHYAPTTLPEPEGLLSVEQLSYSPDGHVGKKPVLSDISFQLEPGTIMAVIGPSGSGKSTLARILSGSISQTSGAVRLDHFELDQWRDDQRGRHIGYVPQDIVLFPGTIAENISRLEPDPKDSDIVRAAQMAGVSALISELPEGYSTRIGPKSMALSGGQRQRIALARAFYSMPKIMVLDEPNAHLDTEGEENLKKCLIAAKQSGASIFVVSQRKSLLQIADRIMTVKEGRIASLEDATSAPKRPIEDIIRKPTERANRNTPPMPDALVKKLREMVEKSKSAPAQGVRNSA